MSGPHVTTQQRSALRGVLAAAVVLGTGAALVSTGTIGLAAGAVLAAKLVTAVAARYAAAQLVDTAPDGAKASLLQRLQIAVAAPPPMTLVPVAVPEDQAVILAALGDDPGRGVLV